MPPFGMHGVKRHLHQTPGYRRESALLDHYEDVLGMHNDMQSGQGRIIELLKQKNAKLKLEINRIQARPDAILDQAYTDQLKEQFSDNLWKIHHAMQNLDDGFHYYERYMKTGRF